MATVSARALIRRLPTWGSAAVAGIRPQRSQTISRPSPFGTWQTASTEVAFNPAYLVELLRALEGEETVRVELQDAEAPALFAVGEEYRHLLMPLRPG